MAEIGVGIGVGAVDVEISGDGGAGDMWGWTGKGGGGKLSGGAEVMLTVDDKAPLNVNVELADSMVS